MLVQKKLLNSSMLAHKHSEFGQKITNSNTTKLKEVTEDIKSPLENQKLNLKSSMQESALKNKKVICIGKCVTI